MQPAEETILDAPMWRVSHGRIEARFVGRTRASAMQIAQALPGAPRGLSWLHQVHSDRVLVAARAGCRGEADALITVRSDLALTIATADCVPVIVGGPRAVAAIHAGWRGIASRIVTRALDALEELGGAEMASIGPAIGACCYEVGEDVAARVVEASSPSVARRGAASGRLTLDLAGAVTAQLAERGVEEIVSCPGCTRCDPRWSSYRRDGRAAGRNRALAWLTPAGPSGTPG